MNVQKYYDNRAFIDKCNRLITFFKSRARDSNNNIHAINAIIYLQLVARVIAVYKSHLLRNNSI